MENGEWGMGSGENAQAELVHSLRIRRGKNAKKGLDMGGGYDKGGLQVRITPAIVRLITYVVFQKEC